MNIDLTDLARTVPEKFVPLFTNQDRYLVLWGGAGSGKSCFAARKLVVRCLLGKHKFFACRKTNANVEKSVVEEIHIVLRQWKIPYHVKQKPFYTFHIDTGAGSQIVCSGLDDPEKVKSVPGITGTWEEEATELDLADFLQIDLRVRGKTDSYKQNILCFNPIERSNWVHGEFFEEQPDLARANSYQTRHTHRTTEDGARLFCTTHHSTYVDNPFMDPEYRAVLDGMASSSQLYYTIYRLGQWGITEGMIYYAFGREWNVGTQAEYDWHLPILWTHDFNIGTGKPMSSCLCHRRGNDFHVFDEIIIDSANTHESATEFHARYPDMAGSTIVYGDSAGRARDTRSNTTDYQILADAGFVRQDIPRKNPSIRDRHNAVNTQLHNAAGISHVVIHPRCKTLIKGMETVKLKAGANYIEEETREQHVTTALGYLINRIAPVVKYVPTHQKHWK